MSVSPYPSVCPIGRKSSGFDLDLQKVDSINAGKTYLKHFSSESIAEQVNANRFEATTDPYRLSEVEAVLICVPTPLDDHREPDLSFVLDTARTIALIYLRACLLLLSRLPILGPRRTNFVWFWKKAQG